MKNWLIVLLIFVIPLGVYAFFDNRTTVDVKKTMTPVIYKFSSPMCADCKVVAKYLEEIQAKRSDFIVKEIDVTSKSGKSKATKEMIKKYHITVTPTLIFIDNAGNYTGKLDTDIKKKDIEAEICKFATCKG